MEPDEGTIVTNRQESYIRRLWRQLGQSFVNRINLGRGHPLPFRVRALLMSKSEQRNFYDALLTPGSADFARVAHELRKRRRRLAVLLPEILKAEWYAERHGLPGPEQASDHYLRIGHRALLAPAERFAGSDGETLSPAGAEFILREGAEVGAMADELLAPDDPRGTQAMNLSNPQRKPLAVVTANFGGHASLLPVDRAWDAAADFFVFTDRTFPATAGWKLLHANYHNVDPLRRASFCKTHLPMYFWAYDRVLWVDGSIMICRDPVPWSVSAESALPVFPYLKESSSKSPREAPDTRILWVRPKAAACRSFLLDWWKCIVASDRLDGDAMGCIRTAAGQTAPYEVGHRRLSESADFAERSTA